MVIPLSFRRLSVVLHIHLYMHIMVWTFPYTYQLSILHQCTTTYLRAYTRAFYGISVCVDLFRHPVWEVFLEEMRIKPFCDVRMTPMQNIASAEFVQHDINRCVHDPTKKDDISCELAVEFVVFLGCVV